MPHNIEKSAFRRGEYIGYGNGQTWRIRKNVGYARTRFAWIATSSGAPFAHYAGTLARLSEKLDRKA
jgi:hypothetical protein